MGLTIKKAEILRKIRSVLFKEFKIGLVAAGVRIPESNDLIYILGLNQKSQPVIVQVEVENCKSLIARSLYLRTWIRRNKEVFQNSLQKVWSPVPHVNWSNVEIICIAEFFDRYDLSLACESDADLKLYKYQLIAEGEVRLNRFHYAKKVSKPFTPERTENPNPSQTPKPDPANANELIKFMAQPSLQNFREYRRKQTPEVPDS